MKKYIALLALLIALIGALFAANFWWQNAAKPVSNQKEDVDFLISKGSSAGKVGLQLQQEGLIRSATAFRLYVQLTGKSKSIQAGEYSLSANYSLTKMVDILSKGPIEVWVTIPEGLRREEVAIRFADGLGKKDKGSFVEEFLSSSKGKEGYLFPDTYLFPKTATAQQVVNKMLTIFDNKIEPFAKDISSAALSKNEIVTLASIVERESRSDSERPVVAGILLNRIDIGMGLGADATVQYAVGTAENWWPILSKEDLATASPYNTYKFRGLPPAPIANPGISSLRAAIFPETSDYLYYLHDAKGQIYYATTLAQHNENIRKYLGK